MTSYLRYYCKTFDLVTACTIYQNYIDKETKWIVYGGPLGTTDCSDPKRILDEKIKGIYQLLYY